MQKLIKKLQANKGHRIFRFLFCVYTPFLFAVTLLPLNLIQSETGGFFSRLKFDNEDKVVHLLLFFVFTFLLFYTAYLKNNYLILWVSILTGILIEILQHLMGMGRTFDLFDIVANTVGILTAFFIFVRKL